MNPLGGKPEIGVAVIVPGLEMSRVQGEDRVDAGKICIADFRWLFVEFEVNHKRQLHLRFLERRGNRFGYG